MNNKTLSIILILVWGLTFVEAIFCIMDKKNKDSPQIIELKHKLAAKEVEYQTELHKSPPPCAEKELQIKLKSQSDYVSGLKTQVDNLLKEHKRLRRYFND